MPQLRFMRVCLTVAAGAFLAAGSWLRADETLLAPPWNRPLANPTSRQLEAPPEELRPGTPPPTGNSPTDAATRRIVEDVLNQRDAELKRKEEEKKKADEARKKEEEARGYEVGSKPGLTAAWNNGLVLQSENKDFRFHVGGRFNFDNVFWHQPAALQAGATPVVVPGTGLGAGLGILDDGAFMRRVRVQMDGTIYELFEFNCESDLEGLNQLFFDEMWAGVRGIPWLGTVRIGQHKVPQGLESYSSSKLLEGLERSALFDAFWQEFGVGIFASNTFLKERATWQAMWHRNTVFTPANAEDIADGTYAFTGRVTALPLYQNGGRHLWHLGASYQFREADPFRSTVIAGTPVPPVPPGIPEPTDVVRFRARAELRDNRGEGGPFVGDPNRFVDTGNIIADHVQTFGAESFAILGPLSIQSEFTLAQVNRAFFPQNATATFRGDPTFWGTYVLVSYFLTGENRGYDRRLARYDRVKPLQNFFWVRDEEGNTSRGLGAWEVIYRYSYVDLDDNTITGGRFHEHTVGINWYLNPNMRIQTNYLLANRIVPAPANSGIVHGLGIRMHLDF